MTPKTVFYTRDGKRHETQDQAESHALRKAIKGFCELLEYAGLSARDAKKIAEDVCDKACLEGDAGQTAHPRSIMGRFKTSLADLEDAIVISE